MCEISISRITFYRERVMSQCKTSKFSLTASSKNDLLRELIGMKLDDMEMPEDDKEELGIFRDIMIHILENDELRFDSEITIAHKDAPDFTSELGKRGEKKIGIEITKATSEVFSRNMALQRREENGQEKKLPIAPEGFDRDGDFERVANCPNEASGWTRGDAYEIWINIVKNCVNKKGRKRYGNLNWLFIYDENTPSISNHAAGRMDYCIEKIRDMIKGGEIETKHFERIYIKEGAGVYKLK